MNYGYIKSELHQSDVLIRGGGYPMYYECKGALGAVRDQGSEPKCVSVCMTDMVNYRCKYNNSGQIKDDSIFFDNRPNKHLQGMSPKDAFHQCRDGLVSFYRARSYSRLQSVDAIKHAIASHGPVMIAMLVKSIHDDFWNGRDNYGGHAVLLTGYYKDGFTLRNSWGPTYGAGGYIKLPYECFNCILEAWCLID